MKFISFIIAFISSFSILSQADNSSVNALKIEANSKLEGGLIGNIEKSTKEVSGSYHLFIGWNNHGIIHAENGRSYRIKNVNFNIKNRIFEYKNEQDSIIGFDLNGAEIEINLRKFKSFYFKKTNDNKIFEIIYHSDLFVLLKDYSSEIKIIKPEGYKDFSINEYIIRKAYYLIKDNKIEKFKLKKRNILSLLNNNSGNIEKYIKLNRLSYKKEEDLKKIFNYYKSL